MDSFRYTITNHLTSNRPKLGLSSLRTYSSVLFNLYKNMTDDITTQNPNLDWFSENATDILDFLLNNIKKSTRKSVLSALYVLTKLPIYHKQMIQDTKDINEEYAQQKKTHKQQENWISIDKIRETYEVLHSKVRQMFKKKMVGDTNTIVDYLLVAFLGGVLMPPRRSLDFALLKWKNYSKETDNYYHRGKLYFNKYKTSDSYGLTIVDVPKELDEILKKWLKINPSEYVLISTNYKPLSSSQITRNLNKIFGKKVSVNMLRHIFLTNYYKDTPKLTEMKNVATKMGHNISTALEYVKK